jgi:hypothetical protein
LNLDLTLARQMLYHLSHGTSWNFLFSPLACGPWVMESVPGVDKYSGSLWDLQSCLGLSSLFASECWCSVLSSLLQLKGEPLCSHDVCLPAGTSWEWGIDKGRQGQVGRVGPMVPRSSFPLLCHRNSKCLSFPAPPSPSHGVCWLFLDSLSYTMAWGGGLCHLCLSQGSLCPCPISTFRVGLFYILSFVFVFSGGRVDLVPVPPSRLEVEVTYLRLTQWLLWYCIILVDLMVLQPDVLVVSWMQVPLIQSSSPFLLFFFWGTVVWT